MRKLVFIIPLVTLISACGAPSVDDLIEDPELLTEITLECNTLMAQGKDTQTETCINATKAMTQMAKNMMKGINKRVYGK